MLNYKVYIVSLFCVGLLGMFITRKNIIVMLMCIEIMLLAVNMNFIIYSIYLDDLFGQIIALFILTVAAAESAIGLAILVVFYRINGTILSLFINSLKG